MEDPESSPIPATLCPDMEELIQIFVKPEDREKANSDKFRAFKQFIFTSSDPKVKLDQFPSVLLPLLTYLKSQLAMDHDVEFQLTGGVNRRLTKSSTAPCSYGEKGYRVVANFGSEDIYQIEPVDTSQGISFRNILVKSNHLFTLPDELHSKCRVKVSEKTMESIRGAGPNGNRDPKTGALRVQKICRLRDYLRIWFIFDFLVSDPKDVKEKGRGDLFKTPDAIALVQEMGHVIPQALKKKLRKEAGMNQGMRKALDVLDSESPKNIQNKLATPPLSEEERAIKNQKKKERQKNRKKLLSATVSSSSIGIQGIDLNLETTQAEDLELAQLLNEVKVETTKITPSIPPGAEYDDDDFPVVFKAPTVTKLSPIKEELEEGSALPRAELDEDDFPVNFNPDLIEIAKSDPDKLSILDKLSLKDRQEVDGIVSKLGNLTKGLNSSNSNAPDIGQILKGVLGKLGK